MRLLKFLPKLNGPRLVIRRVVGDSMVPTLQPGTIIVGLRVRKLKPGDVVIVHHNHLDKVKRIKSIAPGRVFLVGDNPRASTDSRDFGWVAATDITAKVIRFNINLMKPCL